jgi:predicted dehydrogenase
MNHSRSISMARRSSRRRFLATTAAVGAGYWTLGGIAPRESRAANEKIQFACVGVGGKGSSDSQDAGRAGDVVAICDVDEKNLGFAAARWPNAKKYYDFRKMFEEMEKGIDAFTVSTPDHCHAVIAAMGMRLGKHAHVQKPLTHSLWEARMLGQIAAEKNLATQMGNQGTASPSLREAAAVIKSGAVGKVDEVHVWTNRPIWDQGIDRPTDAPEVPATVHWPEWIGPAEMRPYHPAYHPFKWRGWWAFGTGALGDMACHTLNMPFMALDLRDPTSVQAVTSGHNMETYPAWSVITGMFPARNGRAALKYVWYDGKKRPTTDLFRQVEEEYWQETLAEEKKKNANLDEKAVAKIRDAFDKKMSSGAFVVGDGGKKWLLAPGDYAERGIRTSFEKPTVDFVRSPGHFEEWVQAIKGGEAARSNFVNYSVPLTETVLLGNLAVWAAAGDQDPAKRDSQKENGVQGKKIEWDAKNLTATNAPEVAHVVKPELHNGYSL